MFLKSCTNRNVTSVIQCTWWFHITAQVVLMADESFLLSMTNVAGCNLSITLCVALTSQQSPLLTHFPDEEVETPNKSMTCWRSHRWPSAEQEPKLDLFGCSGFCVKCGWYLSLLFWKINFYTGLHQAIWCKCIVDFEHIPHILLPLPISSSCSLDSFTSTFMACRERPKWGNT